MSWKMFLDERLIDGSTKLFIRRDGYMSEGGKTEFVSNFTLETIEPARQAPAAMTSGFSQNPEAKAFLQAALDCAWEAGMRPAGWQDHGREVSALRDHLHDMRALVYAGELKPEDKSPPPLPSSGQKPK